MHVIDALGWGGAERLVLTTVQHLDSCRYQSVVVALSPPLDMKADFDALGIPVHNLALRRRSDFFRGLLDLVRLMRRCRPDVVHTHLPNANLLGRLAAFVSRVPTVVTSLHATEYSHWSTDGLSSKARKMADAIGVRYLSSAVIAVSRTVRDDYARHLGVTNADVIYNYVDPGAFPPAPPSAVEEGRRAFGWTADDFVIVNVGRLSWEKGQETLVRALPRIAAAIPRARLLLVGDGPTRNALSELAVSLQVADRVQFAGGRPSAQPLLGLADIFAFPSQSEGLGIALLEAMAMGLPVVASRAEGITEVVTDGHDALLVPPAEPTALAGGVIRLHDDPGFARELGRRARNTVQRRFSVAVGLPLLESLYARAGAAPRAW